MLDAHPELAIPPETGFLTRLEELRRSGGGRTEAALAAMADTELWPSFNLDRAELAAEVARIQPFDCASAARAFYRLYARRQGKARWGDKTPDYVMRMPAVEALLPEARFIHIFRDGRDVAVSIRPLWFAPGKDMATIARYWCERIEQGRHDGARVAAYLEVRYEALLADPERELRRVCGFAGLDFHPAMLDYHRRAAERLAELRTVYRPDGSVLISGEERRRNHRYALEPPDRERAGRWRRELTREEVAEFNAVAGTWLRELGYEA
jgi:hypothetical protein